MPATVLYILYAFNLLIPQLYREVGSIIIPILQVRKLRLTRLREVACPRSLGLVWNAIGLAYHTLQPL